MTIQNDANDLLKFIYSEYTQKNIRIKPKMLLEKFNTWDGKRIDRAIKYLRDSRKLDVVMTMGNQKGLQNFILRNITPFGIETVENKLQRNLR